MACHHRTLNLTYPRNHCLRYIAGIPLEKAAGTNTAVYASSTSEDYIMMTAKDPDYAPQMVSTSTSPSIQANRLSWYFDLRGPSIHVNTACSSSMITMDLACQSLRSGQSSMVCGAGVSSNVEKR